MNNYLTGPGGMTQPPSYTGPAMQPPGPFRPPGYGGDPMPGQLPPHQWLGPKPQIPPQLLRRMAMTGALQPGGGAMRAPALLMQSSAMNNGANLGAGWNEPGTLPGNAGRAGGAYNGGSPADFPGLLGGGATGGSGGGGFNFPDTPTYPAPNGAQGYGTVSGAQIPSYIDSEGYPYAVPVNYGTGGFGSPGGSASWRLGFSPELWG